MNIHVSTSLLTGLEWTANITWIAFLTAGNIVLSFDRKSEGARKKDGNQSDRKLHDGCLSCWMKKLCCL